MGLRSKNLQNEMMQPQEAGLDRLEIVQLTSRCQISTSVVPNPMISVYMAHVIDSFTHFTH